MMSYTEEHWDRIAPYLFQLNNTLSDRKKSELPGKIKQYYFGNKQITTDKHIALTLTHAVGDGVIASWVAKSVKLQAKVTKSPVYFYQYNYSAAQSMTYSFSNTTDYLGLINFILF